jgi:hypothetical protein
MSTLSLLDELRTIARNGLTYAENEYDRQRYERLLELTSQQYADYLDLPVGLVKERLQAETGYITPKVGADAAIFDDEGRILLMQRTDDQRWCLPCGWLEPNESPQEAVVRETWEETGLHVEPVALFGVFTRRPDPAWGLFNNGGCLLSLPGNRWRTHPKPRTAGFALLAFGRSACLAWDPSRVCAESLQPLEKGRCSPKLDRRDTINRITRT